MVRAIPTPLEFDDHAHSMLVLRVRAAPWISPAAVHVSSNGSSYLQVCDSLGHITGGKLLEPMIGEGEIQEDGPLMRIAGPDATILRVLSERDWKLGRQPMLIENEWCFVRQLVAAGGDRYRPMGSCEAKWALPSSRTTTAAKPSLPTPGCSSRFETAPCAQAKGSGSRRSLRALRRSR